MGYTHYWYRKPELDAKTFVEFSKDIARLIASAAVPVAREYDDPQTRPLVDVDEIRFNGIDGDGHETFHIGMKNGGRKQDDGTVFDFCKTARKPYDLLVTASLIAAKKHFGEDIKVSSDGDDEDWEEARDLCERVLGYGGKLHLNKDIDGDHDLKEKA